MCSAEIFRHSTDQTTQVSTPNASEPDQSLPRGAIAGLAAGLGVGMILLAIALAGFTILHRQKRRAFVASSGGADSQLDKSELHGEGYHVEKPADPIDHCELQHVDVKHELKGDGQVHEVEGDQVTEAVHADDAAATDDQILEKS